MLTETAARWLLVLHTTLGVAAVAAATHLVVWSRGFLRGSFGRLRAARRFAWIALVLQVLGFVAGNAMYPTYKVEVRTAYLEDRDALAADRRARQARLAEIAAREGAAVPQVGELRDRVRGGAGIARWFDIKEHWVALGILASLALVLVLRFWDPRAGRELAPIVLGLAVLVAGTLWLAAVIGVLTSAWRAV